VSLGGDGCGLGYYLIISGPERGHIWEFHDLGINPLQPRQGFMEWFGAWLERRKSSTFDGYLSQGNFRQFRRWLEEQGPEPDASDVTTNVKPRPRDDGG
jgi:hypothetical protein